jgi:hypothetical protein
MLLSLSSAAGLLVSACGGGGEADAQVASLSAEDDATGTGEAAETEVDSQQAALDFAQCMRDNGLDVADPTFDEEGNLEGGLFGGGPGGPDSDTNPGSDGGLDAGSEDAQAAFEACGDLLEGVGFGPGGGEGGFNPDEIEATLVEFTECLREEGLDVGDLTLGGPGGGGGPGAGDGGNQEAPGGQAQDGGPGGPGGDFDPETAMIEALGLDPDDEAVVTAVETCQPLLESAFQGGPGGTDGPDAVNEE